MHHNRALRLAAFALVSAACGGGESSTAPETDLTPATISSLAGDAQTARVGSAVTTPPAVVVRNAAGQALSGVEVSFAVEAGGGAVAGGTVSTDATGVARATSWTVGPSAGENRLRATVVGSASLTTLFSAEARWPHWTVMVYMAADNNLAVEGIFDIDEMEAAGQDPEVNVVVQAEFNPTQLSVYGCDASCFNRPNFNTFRYVLNGTGPSVTGPDGAATDIGNRDMTNPQQLTEFIGWAKQVTPAERYILVLWNHGGGYTGLLQDETSAGSQLMSMAELATALQSVGPVDIIDFDMCLMAGYETLHSLQGLAEYAVFSEELVPGKGNPYDTWLGLLQARSGDGPAVVAAALVDAFHAGYQGDRSSTTKSAYSLSEYVAFETSLDALAEHLRTNLGTLNGAIDGSLEGTQKYAYAELTDLVTWLDDLRGRTTDATLHARIDDLKGRATAGQFRLRNLARNGTDVGFGGASDVARSTGLHIVLPRGVGDDHFADSGPRSFSAYQALYPNRPWTQFLAEWTAAHVAVAYTDQGALPFQGYLVWDSASVRLDADVDLWILEPNGELYIPWLGSVTPNGTLTSDSYEDGAWFEGYLTNRFLENGRYKLYANLWQDPSDHRPIYDLLYRYGFTSTLMSLYAPSYPELSMQISWEDDATPTFAELEAGAYTDLQYVASLDIGVPGSPLAAPQWGPLAAESPVQGRPTSAQLERVRVEAAKRAFNSPDRSGEPAQPVSGSLKAVPR